MTPLIVLSLTTYTIIIDITNDDINILHFMILSSSKMRHEKFSSFLDDSIRLQLLANTFVYVTKSEPYTYVFRPYLIDF